MIKRLIELIRQKRSESKVVEVAVEIDTTNIYVRLKMAMDRIGTTQAQLTASPISLGRIESFSDTLADFLKSLMEVNASLKDNKHIEGGLFYIKKIRSVKLDKFLFVHNGYYVDDAPVTLQRVLEQIDTYYEVMKEADIVPYGVMEHNHRQLYTYTETLIQFLDSIFYHFGE